jgi:hypothetical protein
MIISVFTRIGLKQILSTVQKRYLSMELDAFVSGTLLGVISFEGFWLLGYNSLQSGECMYVCPTEMSFEFHQITKHCIPK